MRDADTLMRVAATPRRGAASAALLTRLAAEHGMPVERCLRDTGLTAADLSDPEAEIGSGQELALVANIVADLGRVPGLGLEAGRRYHPTTFGMLGLAALSSATLGDAVGVGLRYLGLTFAFSPFVCEPVDGGLRVVIDDRAVRAAAGEGVARFLAEREAAAVVTFMRDLLGCDPPVRHVAFRHPAPPWRARYEQVLGVRPSFGRPETCGVLAARALGAPLPLADAWTAELSRRHCERQLLDRRSTRGDLSELVRAELLRRLERGEGIATETQVATGLNLSQRSLRRRLRGEGARFSVLAAEAMAITARRLLAAGHTVESVAAALGYASGSSFSHAFKRRTGCSPGAYAHGAQRSRTDNGVGVEGEPGPGR